TLTVRREQREARVMLVELRALKRCDDESHDGRDGALRRSNGAARRPYPRNLRETVFCVSPGPATAGECVRVLASLWARLVSHAKAASSYSASFSAGCSSRSGISPFGKRQGRWPRNGSAKSFPSVSACSSRYAATPIVTASCGTSRRSVRWSLSHQQKIVPQFE